MRLDRAEEAGGIAYVSGLPDNVPSTENLDHYADIVRERALSRRLVEIAERARDAAMGGSGTPAEQIEATQAALDALGAAQPSEGWRYVADLLDEEVIRIQAAAERRGQMSGLPTGLAELDRILCGLQPGNLIVLGARPGCGKTSLAINAIARTAATVGAVGVFSLEMSRGEIVTRLLCCEARVDSSRIRRGTLTGEDWDALMPAAERLGHLPILIDDTPGLTPSQIRARVLKLKALRPDLGLIVVDYLGLIGGHGTDQDKAGAAAVALKSLAKELQIPVVALAQLNRGVESRPDKRPVASDLRDSGKVEQTADVIVLIFRDELYNRESTRKGEADLLIVKHRNGGVGDVAVAFEAEFTRFGDLARPVDSWGGR
jgi:replicative DNA helicase